MRLKLFENTRIFLIKKKSTNANLNNKISYKNTIT